MNLLNILNFPYEGNIADFKDWFIKTTEKVFYEVKNEMKPMGILLTHDGICMMIYPDFSSDDRKSQSMAQIKRLSALSHGVAFGLVSEAWFKNATIDDKETMNLMRDINYQVSLLSDRQEVLMCSIEERDGDRIKNTLIKVDYNSW